MHHHLAGHLGLHTPQLERRQLLLIDLADVRLRIGAQRHRQPLDSQRLALLDLDLLVVAHHPHDARESHLTGALVDMHADVVLVAVAIAGGLLVGLLDRLHDNVLLDRLLARDRIGDR